MFDARAFRSWPLIMIGAGAFSALFVLAALLAGRLTTGTFAYSGRVWVLGAAAFVGYLGAALLVRNDRSPGSRP